MLFCHLLIFFKIDTFEKFLQEYQQYQTVSNSLDPDEPLCFGNQRVCKGYQQTESVGKNLKYFLLKKVIIDYFKLVACWEFVSLFFFVCWLFRSPEPKAQCELLWSVFVRSLLSVNFFLKRRFLLNYWSKFHITSHECSPWCPVSKLHNCFHSTEQEGRQSSR